MRKPLAALTHLTMLAIVLAAVSPRAQATDFQPILQAPACARDTSSQAQGLPDEARIFGWIEEMVSLGKRLPGTEGGARSAAWVKCQFEALGLQDVHYETAKTWLWRADRSALKVNGREVGSFPVSYSFVTPDKASAFATPPGGLQAELVDVGSGQLIDPKKVRGKLVVFDLKFEMSTAMFLPFVDFIWDPQLSFLEPNLFAANPYLTNLSKVVQKLQDAGAVGFVGVLSDYYDSNRYHNEYYRRTQMTIPGVWVTRKDGEVIRGSFKPWGKRPAANLVLEGSRTEVEGRAVVGVLPGRSQETILMTSHHDSVSAGAVEDASGVASLLAQLQHAASKPAEQRNKTMLFATMDSHFTGYQVHQAFTDKYVVNPRTPMKVVAGVTLEHVARQGVVKNGQLTITDRSEILGILNNFSNEVRSQLHTSMVRHDLRRSATMKAGLLCDTVGLPTDASFWCRAGVPTASLIAAPVYLYDEDDTLDKVARDKLVPVARVFADLADVLDRTPADRIGR